MGPSDPISAEPDDPAEAQRLRAFFSAASAQLTDNPPPPPPAAPAVDPVPEPEPDDRPPPTGPPVFATDVTDVADAIDPEAPVDMAHLVAYLDAQLDLTRRRADEGVERVLAALATIDERVGELETFRDELFEWLESYVGWEATTLAEIAGRVDGAPSPRPAPAAVDAAPSEDDPPST
jgi:hypothetical protein